MDPEDPKAREHLRGADLILDRQAELTDARSLVHWLEADLARLRLRYPDVAETLPPPLKEFTAADLRSDELNSALLKINAKLGWGLTGEEPDYWLKLTAYAREKGLCDDDFREISQCGKAAAIRGQKKLVAFVQDHLGGPKGIPEAERKPLLDAYKKAMVAAGHPMYSDRQLYLATNSPAGEREFKKWKYEKLPRTSQTAMNIERFLQKREVPKA